MNPIDLISLTLQGALNQVVDAAPEDKPPNYDDLSFGDISPPDYYTAVNEYKIGRYVLL